MTNCWKMMLSSLRSVSWKLRTRTCSSLPTCRTGTTPVLSVRNDASTWYSATNSPARRWNVSV